jgi:hypothetical protein
VSHLPWKFLIFRSLNTFIDDLFAFGKCLLLHRYDGDDDNNDNGDDDDDGKVYQKSIPIFRKTISNPNPNPNPTQNPS